MISLENIVAIVTEGYAAAAQNCRLFFSFNPTTVISYQLPAKSFVSLRVFDMFGREVAMLVNEEKPAGIYRVRWNAEGYSSGVYFYQLEAGSFSQTRKLLLMR